MHFKISAAGYFFAIAVLVSCAGCGTVKRAAVKQMGDALSSEKTMTVISSDNDPDLVWDMMPFALKTMEVMLAQDPSNTGLKLALASCFVQYAQGHLAQQAQMMEDTDYKQSRHLWQRAYNLSIRGRDYALSALDSEYPGFSRKIRTDTSAELALTGKDDVPLLYWASAGWACAIAADKSNMETMAELPVAVAMMRRVLELDENYRDGAPHEFFMVYEASQPNRNEASMKNSEMHFKKVVELTNGRKAYPYVMYAESVALKKQDIVLFNSLLDKALAVDVNAVPEWRLSNTIAQERALWLKGRIPVLFVDFKEEEQ